MWRGGGGLLRLGRFFLGDGHLADVEVEARNGTALDGWGCATLSPLD